MTANRVQSVSVESRKGGPAPYLPDPRHRWGSSQAVRPADAPTSALAAEVPAPPPRSLPIEAFERVAPRPPSHVGTSFEARLEGEDLCACFGMPSRYQGFRIMRELPSRPHIRRFFVVREGRDGCREEKVVSMPASPCGFEHYRQQRERLNGAIKQAEAHLHQDPPFWRRVIERRKTELQTLHEEHRGLHAIEASASVLRKIENSRRPVVQTAQSPGWLWFRSLRSEDLPAPAPLLSRVAEVPEVSTATTAGGMPVLVQTPPRGAQMGDWGYSLGQLLTHVESPQEMGDVEAEDSNAAALIGRLCEFLPVFAELCRVAQQAHKADLVLGNLRSNNIRISHLGIELESWAEARHVGTLLPGQSEDERAHPRDDFLMLADLLLQLVAGQDSPASRLLFASGSHSTRLDTHQLLHPGLFDGLLPNDAVRLRALIDAILPAVSRPPRNRMGGDGQVAPLVSRSESERFAIDLGSIADGADALAQTLVSRHPWAKVQEVTPLAHLPRGSRGVPIEPLTNLVERWRRFRGGLLPLREIDRVFGTLLNALENNDKNPFYLYGGFAPEDLLLEGDQLHLGSVFSLARDSHEAVEQRKIDFRNLGASLWLMLTGQALGLSEDASHVEIWEASRLSDAARERLEPGEAARMQALLDLCLLPPVHALDYTMEALRRVFCDGVPDMRPAVEAVRGLEVRWVDDEFEDLWLIARGGEADIFLARRRDDQALIALRVPKFRTNALAMAFESSFEGIGDPPSMPLPAEVRAAERMDRGEGFRVRILGVEARKPRRSSLRPQRFYFGDGRVAYAREYIPAVSAARLLEPAVPKVPVHVALDWAIQLFEQLAEIHERGFVHRDIKLNNWLIDFQWRLHQIDFGATASIDQPDPEPDKVIGTWHYTCHSQIKKKGPLDPRADLYSAGVALYHLLTRQWPRSLDSVPSSGRILSAFASLQKNVDVVPLLDHRADVPPEFADLIEQLLVYNLDDRPRTARQVLERLRRLRRDAAEDQSGEKVLLHALGQLIKATVDGHKAGELLDERWRAACPSGILPPRHAREREQTGIAARPSSSSSANDERSSA